MHLGPHSLFRGGELHDPGRRDRKGLKLVGLLLSLGYKDGSTQISNYDTIFILHFVTVLYLKRVKEALEKIQHPFTIKNKVSIEGIRCHDIADMTGLLQITWYPSERLKVFLLRSERGQEAQSHHFWLCSTEVPARVTEQEQRCPNCKEVKLSVYRQHDLIHRKPQSPSNNC